MATLPFRTTGALQEQGGAAVAGADAVPCTVWPASGHSNSPQARVYSHSGEAHLDFAAQLQVPNRQLLVDGVTYKIVAATPFDLVPHVALQLRKVEANG